MSILLCLEGLEAVTLAEERGGITLTAIQHLAGVVVALMELEWCRIGAYLCSGTQALNLGHNVFPGKATFRSRDSVS